MKYLKKYRLFERELIDNEEDDLVARSDDWSLYRFKNLGDYIEFDMRISPNEPLSKGPFSTGRNYKDTTLGANEVYLNSVRHLFNNYQERYGDLFVLINSDDIKKIYYFNCGEGIFFGVFDYEVRTKSPLTKEISDILESLDYTDSKIEWWIKSAIDNNGTTFKVLNRQ